MNAVHLLEGPPVLVFTGKHQIRYLNLLPSYVESGAIVVKTPEFVASAYNTAKAAFYSIEFEKFG